MCVGVAVAESDVPVREFDRHRMGERVYVRDGAREVRFLWQALPTLLPVWRDCQVTVAAWGSKARRSPLPYGGWTWESTLENGGWANARVELVDIPAAFTLAGGVWSKVRHGVKGVLVTGWEHPVVYMLCRPSTRYYRAMTGVNFQPVLVGEAG